MARQGALGTRHLERERKQLTGKHGASLQIKQEKHFFNKFTDDFLAAYPCSITHTHSPWLVSPGQGSV